MSVETLFARDRAFPERVIRRGLWRVSSNTIARVTRMRPPTLAQTKTFASRLIVPTLGMMVFIALWHFLAQKVETSLGAFPGPAQVYAAVIQLGQEHGEVQEKKAKFYARQDKRHAKALARDPDAPLKFRRYVGAPSFFELIATSLITVLTGFLLASVIAVPLGIFCGLSHLFNRAVNPIIQLFKPVSPLAWLPLVTMVVSAVYVSDDPAVSKSFVTSAVTVALCCLWPALINTAVGVAGISQDLLNVSRVLRLNTAQHIGKIVLPASLPMIFTGLRLSLGIGWMVLIAAEMLAQNPGLGKFVWDEFQNGSSSSLSRIMVAVLVIGGIGFLLDLGMLSLQRWFNWDKSQQLR